MTNERLIHKVSQFTSYEEEGVEVLGLVDTVARFVDVDNSTRVALVADAVFTGSWISNINYESLVLHVLTDQDSAVGGLQIQQSSDDGVTVEHVHDYKIIANTHGYHIPCRMTGTHYRIIYTNGSVAQGTFILSATLSKYGSNIHSHELDHLINDSHPAQLTRAVIAGKKPDQEYSNALLSQKQSLYVHQEVHEEADISVHMTEDSGVVDTLASSVNKGALVLPVTNGGLWAVGDKICLGDDVDSEYDILTVKAILANDLTIDRPLDVGHASGRSLVGKNVNMAVDGSGIPRIFYWEPRYESTFHIHTIHITISSTQEPALFRYGGLSALQFGTHFRAKNITGRDDTYWIPFRSNNAMRLSGFTYEKENKVGTNWFVHMTMDLDEETNAVIPIDSRIGQVFECRIQDDLSGLTSQEVKLSIHEEPIS